MQNTKRSLHSMTLLSAKGARARRVAPIALAASAIVSFAGAASAAVGVPTNGRISFGEFWSDGNQRSEILGMSDDGRYLAYYSAATNITDEDTNPRLDCYRYDRTFGITLLMSVTPGGVAGNGHGEPYVANSRMLSGDGRYVMYSSTSSDLVAGDTNLQVDAFIHDTDGWGSNERVSLGANGVEIGGPSLALGMSADATKFLFTTNVKLSAIDGNTGWDIYQYDRVKKTVLLVSATASGAVGSNVATMSASGNEVAFMTTSNVLPTVDGNLKNDIYWKDLTTGTIKLVSSNSLGVVGDVSAETPAISGDGKRVAFTSRSTNLVPNDTNGKYDVFVKDVTSGGIARASTDSGGAQSADPRCFQISLNGNGHIVSMGCQAGDLVAGDNNGLADIFTKDLDSGITTLVSQLAGATNPLGDAGSSFPVISKDGSSVGFTSAASNLSPNSAPDKNAKEDVYVGNRF